MAKKKNSEVGGVSELKNLVILSFIGLKFFSKPETEDFYCPLCDGGWGGVRA